MPREFRQIASAPLYEMDNEGNIQKIDGKTPAIPSPRGSKNFFLWVDDVNRQTFNLDTLIEETFGESKEVVEEPVVVHEYISENTQEEKIEDEFIPLTPDEIPQVIAEEIAEEKVEEKETDVPREDGYVPAKRDGEEIKPKKVAKESDNSEKSPSIKKETRGRKPKVKAPKKDFSYNPMIGKIMALNTFVSVKIWKLHHIGVSNEDIRELVDALHVTVISKTLAEYEKKENLRIRAEKVIVK